MKRYATAVWNGTGKDGNGKLSTQSTVLNSTQFSFNSRFTEGVGTNPEELLAAAHAGCFTMKLSFVLDEAGFKDKTIETTCHISLENGGITESHLLVKATIPGISQEVFGASVKDAEMNCPLSKVLNAKITVESVLEI
jgi:lipoyl-dependent peroxiredoxin